MPAFRRMLTDTRSVAKELSCLVKSYLLFVTQQLLLANDVQTVPHRRHWL